MSDQRIGGYGGVSDDDQQRRSAAELAAVSESVPTGGEREIALEESIATWRILLQRDTLYPGGAPSRSAAEGWLQAKEQALRAMREVPHG